MAEDKIGTWSLGESKLWFTPTSGIDATWSLGENYILDEYIADAGGGRPEFRGGNLYGGSGCPEFRGGNL